MPDRDLQRQLLKQAHIYIEMRVGLCPEALLFESTPGATIAPIGAIYAHAVINEDSYVQRELRGATPLFERAEWASKLAFPPKVALDAGWPARFRTDIPLFRRYARTVYESSDAYVAGLTDADSEGEVPKHVVFLRDGTPAVERRVVTLAFDFADMVTLHIVEHAGEISALLGVKGLKGSPRG
jgi:hypothetical protein